MSNKKLNILWCNADLTWEFLETSFVRRILLKTTEPNDF